MKMSIAKIVLLTLAVVHASSAIRGNHRLRDESANSLSNANSSSNANSTSNGNVTRNAYIKGEDFKDKKENYDKKEDKIYYKDKKDNYDYDKKYYENKKEKNDEDKKYYEDKKEIYDKDKKYYEDKKEIYDKDKKYYNDKKEEYDKDKKYYKDKKDNYDYDKDKKYYGDKKEIYDKDKKYYDKKDKKEEYVKKEDKDKKDNYYFDKEEYDYYGYEDKKENYDKDKKYYEDKKENYDYDKKYNKDNKKPHDYEASGYDTYNYDYDKDKKYYDDKKEKYDDDKEYFENKKETYDKDETYYEDKVTYDESFGFESRLILQMFKDSHTSGNNYIFVRDYATRDNARRSCQKQGGDLASLTSREVTDLIRPDAELQGYGKFWVGVHKNFGKDKSAWKWFNGEKLKPNFDSKYGILFNANQQFGCLVFHVNKAKELELLEESCDTPDLGFICQYPFSDFSGINSNFGFDPELIKLKIAEQHTYGHKYVIVNMHETYDNARKNCQNKGGELAALATKAISDQIDMAKLKGKGKFWVGVWKNFSKEKLDWKWIDPPTPLKPNFDPKKGLLFNADGAHSCIVLTVDSPWEGQLEEHDCNSPTSGFICQSYFHY